MAITVKHSKVSTIPDGDDPSVVRPSDWNADHTLDGLGTMAEQDSDAVDITGGTITGVSVAGYVPDTRTITAGTGLTGGGDLSANRTLAIANTTVTAASYGSASKTLTATVNAQGQLTALADTNIAIANTQVSGLGTASTKDAGVALGVATLDASGKVPLSEIPDSIIGALSYQGTWNALTNTPTLTSSVGTKGYYYVVDVAGTTNLNGITDWQIGDWAIFNGTVWQKVDNTDAVTSVNGYTGTVVLTQPDIAGTANSGTNTNITSMTGITGGISTVDFVGFDTTYATTLTAGELGWDGNNTLAIGMAGGNVVQHIGEDTFYYIKASSAITKGQVIMFTGAVGASGVITGAPANGVSNGQYIMGIAAESIALNGFGLVQNFGKIRNINTSGFSDGDVVYYDQSVTGGFTKTFPTTGPIVTVAAVINGGSSGGGSLQVRITVSERNIAGTGISVSQSSSGSTITNTAPDQTVVLTGGTGISTSGTYPNFTITNTSPSSGGTVTSITAGTGLTGGTITSSGTIAIDSTVATLTGSQILTNKTISGATNTLTNIGNSSLTNSSITINGSAVSLGGSTSVGTVTSVAATGGTGISVSGSPITSSGTLTITNTAPDQTVAIASGTGISVTGTYPNFTVTNTSPSSGGTVTSVAALTLGTTGTDLSSTVANSTTTPVITLNVPTASASNRGALSSTDWSTFNSKAPGVTFTTSYVPYGQGTTTLNQSSSFTYASSTLTAPIVSASNGLVVNSNTVSASYSIPSGSSAMSTGPMTVASGQTVTIPSGSRWVVL